MLARAARPPFAIVLSLGVLGLVLLAVLFGNLLLPDATGQDILHSLLPPFSPGHLLGTDELGRDILALAVAGTASAVVGPACIAVGSMALGVVLGSVAGFHRGALDFAIGRWTDLLMALPVILMAIVVAGIFGSGYWVTVLLLITLFSPSDIRVVRSGVIEQSSRPYVEAARMLGLSSPRIMFRHILPNVSSLVVTNCVLNMAIALVALSSLSFLGLGVPANAADWGRQLADGRSLLGENPAAVLTPAILIIAVACSINILGDWLGVGRRGAGPPSTARLSTRRPSMRRLSAGRKGTAA